MPAKSVVSAVFSAILLCSSKCHLSTATALPAPASLVFADHDARELRSRLDDIKDSLKIIQSAKLLDINEKLNSVVLSLSQIDSNVKGLQERAHVWDTFQLHVSAWNDQIKAVDKKLDLLSRRPQHGSIPVNPELDQRFSEVVSKLEKFVEKLDPQESRIPDDPIIAEFAAKGVMTTLKSLDTKVDVLVKSAAITENATIEERRRFGEDREAENKVLVATVVEELLETGACVSMSGKGRGDVNLEKEEDEDDQQQVSKNVRRLLEMLGDLRSDVMTHLEDEDRKEDEPPTKNGLKTVATELEALTKEVGSLKQVITSGAAAGFPQEGGGKRQNCMTSWNEVEKKLKFKFSSIATHVEETHKCCFDQSHRFKGFQATTEFKLGQLDEVLRTHEFNDERRLGLIQDHYTRQMSELLNRVDKMSLKLDRTCVVASGFSVPELSSNDDDNEDEVLIQNKPIKEPSSKQSVDAPVNGKDGCPARKPVGGKSGVIYIPHDEPMDDPFFNYYIRYCDQDTDGGGWTVILRRNDYGMPRQNFSQTWDTYTKGFGNIEKEFWFGTEQIHRLTAEEPQVLRVELEDFEGNTVFAEYSSIQVLNATTNYTLMVQGYSGNATDSLSAHNGSQFSTYDRINDQAPDCCPCSPAYGASGWWFYACFESNLTGPYFQQGQDNQYYQGIIWEHFKGDYSLKRAEMKVRPKNFTARKHRRVNKASAAAGSQEGSPKPTESPSTKPWWSSLPVAEDP